MADALTYEAEAAAREPQVTFVMGPPMSYFEDERGRHIYVTLCQSGLKVETEAAPSETDESEAWDKYWAQLHDYLAANSAKEVTWRKTPHLEWNDEHTKCYVRSRLVVTERIN